MGHASARLDAVHLDAPPPSLRAPMGEGLGAPQHPNPNPHPHPNPNSPMGEGLGEPQQFDNLTPTLPLTLSLTLTSNP